MARLRAQCFQLFRFEVIGERGLDLLELYRRDNQRFQLFRFEVIGEHGGSVGDTSSTSQGFPTIPI